MIFKNKSGKKKMIGGSGQMVKWQSKDVWDGTHQCVLSFQQKETKASTNQGNIIFYK